jgi:hypothetical protein
MTRTSFVIVAGTAAEIIVDKFRKGSPRTD